MNYFIIIFILLNACFPIISFGNEKPNDASNPFQHETIHIEENTKKLSFNFQKIETKKALQSLASIAKKNIILSDSISGTLTMEIHDLTWDEVFHLILKIKNLGYRYFNHVIFVAPLSEITSQQKQELLLEQQQAEYTPLSSILIPINYGKAPELAKLLKEKGKSLLSSRGNVSVDARTNTLWIEDHPKKLEEIKHFIKELDIPVKQVLIEARIINVDTHYEQELGIQFRNTIERTQPLPRSKKHKRKSRCQTENPFCIDLPSSKHFSATGNIALATLGKNILLDLELSAMESTQSGEIISNPKIITADQQPAFIQSGEEIPYQETTASGATNVAFKKALLSLQVTPQVTPDNKILMHLKINQDKRGQTTNGVPSIDTQQIETQVLAENGDTLVLGGIYERSKSNGIERIPFISDIPLLGELFNFQHKNQAKKELIIFITPTIVPYEHKEPIP